MNVQKPLLPSTLPGLTKEATRLAKAAYTGFCKAMKASGGYRHPWNALTPLNRKAHVETHAALLCDLSNDGSMDWAARWLAERVGLKVGATAPSWSRGEGGQWILETCDLEGERTFVCFMEPEIEGDVGGDTYRVVQGITRIEHPVAAMVLACTMIMEVA